MNTLSYNDILDYIALNYIKLGGGEVLKFLHPDPDLARKAFVYDVRRGLARYTDDKPLILSFRNRCDKYCFNDNFQAYLEGRLLEKDIELNPISIASIRVGPGNGTYITKNNWEYDPMSKTLIHGLGFVKYYANYPNIYKFSKEDNKFTEDSKIYMVDESDFLDELITAETLRDIITTRNSVSNISGIQALNLSEIYQNLENKLQVDSALFSNIYETY